MFKENHTKYTERTLSTNVSQEYNIFTLKNNNCKKKCLFDFRNRSNNNMHFFKEKSTQLYYDTNTIVNTKYNDYQSLERANTDSDNSTITCTMN